MCAANDALGKLGDNVSMNVQVAGCGGVPGQGVSAVVVNVTVAETTGDSFLTVWPAGIAQPGISNLNYLPGQAVPNLVTVALGTDGKLSVYNKRGLTHVIFDVVGYYADDEGNFGSRFHGLNPSRFFDTRDGQGGVGVGQLGPDAVLKFKVTGKNFVPATNVTAVVMNVTVTGPPPTGSSPCTPTTSSTGPRRRTSTSSPGRRCRTSWWCACPRAASSTSTTSAGSPTWSPMSSATTTTAEPRDGEAVGRASADRAARSERHLGSDAARRLAAEQHVSERRT